MKSFVTCNIKKESVETLNDVVLKLENTGLFSLKEGKRLLKILKRAICK